jgi:FMN-dependent NADH-azoreductase
MFPWLRFYTYSKGPSMNLLHLDSSVLGGNSVSRTVSAAVVAQLKKTHPGLKETYRDLAANPVPHLSGAYLAALQSTEGQHEASLQADLALGGKVLEEFIAADILVIGLGLYNFTIPTQLKAWIDRIAVAGKTFRYTEKGPVGLMGGKRVILAIARGGFYGPGMPAAPYEHGETYLRAVFGFLGIPNPEVIVAEGIAIGPEQREKSINAALAQAAGLPLAA